MQTKTRKYINPNFLNNQNYILGNQEKKKVLSKFFIEKMIEKIINIFSFTNSMFYNEKYYYKNDSEDSLNFLFIFILYIIIFFGMLINGYFYSKINYSIFNLYLVYTIFLLTTPIFFYSGYILIKNFEFKKIKSLDDFFFVKGFSFLNGSLIVGFFIFIISKFYLLPNIDFLMAIIFTLLIIINIFLQKTFNFFNIIFLPIIIPIIFLNILLSYLKTFFIKIDKISKLNPNSNLLKKFDFIEKNNAENEFYKISLKNDS